MASPPPVRRIHRYTYDAYLEHESSSNVKHEFLDGEIYAMAGGSLQRAVLAGNVISALGRQLRDRPCVVASSDLKVRVMATGLTTYPDVTVICGPAEPDPKSRHVVLNPTLVVEVTSDSTEEWDRGEKLEHYQGIASLQACVLVSHRQRRIEVRVRAEDGAWRSQSAGPGAELALPLHGATLAVDEVYRNVEVPG
jgi:Uma2 family endonuclease